MKEKIKNFLKDNWFKLIISFGMILICVSAGYYFLVSLPKEKAEQKNLENQIKCQEIGYKLYRSQTTEIENSGNYLAPEFKFIQNSNICLYKGGFVGDKYISFFIMDVYKNKTILSWDRFKDNNKWKDFIGSEEEWNKKSKEIFEY